MAKSRFYFSAQKSIAGTKGAKRRGALTTRRRLSACEDRGHKPDVRADWRVTAGLAGLLACGALVARPALATDWQTTQTTSLQAGDTVTTTANGNTGIGLRADLNTTVEAPGGNVITTSGQAAYGMQTTGGTLNATGTTVTTSGANANAVLVQSTTSANGSANLTGGQYTTSGQQANGIQVGFAGAAGSLTATDVTVRTTGNLSDGINVQSSVQNQVSITGGTVHGEGAGGSGMNLAGPTVVSGTHVDVHGEAAFGIRGANAGVTISDAQITSENGTGLMYQTNNTADATATVTNTAISSSGSGLNSSGYVQYGGAWAKGVSGATLGGLYLGTGVTVDTTGTWNPGLVAAQSGILTADAITVTTHGDNSAGVLAFNKSKVTLNGTNITTHGDGATGVDIGLITPSGNDGNTVVIQGASVNTNGDNASAIRLAGPTNTYTADAATSLTTTGANSHGISIVNGSSKTYSFGGDVLPGVIDVTGSGSAAFDVSGVGSNLTFADVANPKATNRGTDSWDVLAEEGGTATFSGSTSATDEKLWAKGSSATNTGKLVFAGTSTATGSLIRLDSNGELSIGTNQNKQSFSIGALTGAGGTVSLGATLGSKTNLMIAGASGSNTSAAAITGYGDLIMNGDAAQVQSLTGDSAFGFTGNVIVTSGTLAVGGQAQAAGKDFHFNGTNAGTLDIQQVATGFEVGTIQSDAQGQGAIVLGTKTLTVGGSGNSNFSGSITGTGGLTKDGTGTLTLGGPNAFQYSGTTTVANGTLAATDTTDGAATASQHAFSFGTNGVLDVSGANRFAAGSIQSQTQGAGTINLGPNALTIDGTNASTFSGTITGSGQLIKSNTGVLTLSGNNALGFTGNAVLNGGVLAVRDVDPATFTKTFELNGGWLDMSDTTYDSTGNTANNWNNVTLVGNPSTGGVIGGNDNATYNVGAGVTNVVNYQIGGDPALNGQGVFVVKQGDGTLELANDNAYVGNTRIQGGILKVSRDANLGDTSVAREVVLNGGKLEIAGTFNSQRNIELRQNGAVIVDNANVANLGALQGVGYVFTKEGSGTLGFANGGAVDGLVVQDGALNLTNVNVGAAGSANPVTVHGTGLSMSGGSITSTGDAIVTDSASQVLLANHTAITTGNGGAAFRATNGANATLELRNQDLTGGVVADGAATRVQFNLGAGSTYSGAPTGDGKVSMALNDASSTWNLTDNASVSGLVNLGTVAFQAPTGGAYKSLSVNGNYAGGGTVVLNTVLNDGGALTNQQTDRLLVHGDVTGQTSLKLNTSGNGANTNLAKNNGYIPTEGISLVQVSGNSSASAFSLAGGYVTSSGANPFQYRLFAYGPGQKASADPSQSVLGNGENLNWDYRLETAYLDNNGNAVPGQKNNSPDPVDPQGGRKALVPQGSSYLTAGLAMQNYGATVMDNLQRRLGDIRRSDAEQGDSANAEAFARYIGNSSKYVSDLPFNSYGYDFRQSIQALQVGGNWLASHGADQRFRVGVAGTFGTSTVNPDTSSAENSKTTLDGRTVSLIGTWTHNDGWYVDGVLSAALYTGPVKTPERGQVTSLRGTSIGASVEAGKTIPLPHGFEIEPQVQLTAQSLHINNFTDSDGVSAQFNSTVNWTSRVGVRLAYAAQGAKAFVPYARLSFLHSGGGPTSAVLSTTPFQVGGTGSAIQLSMGASGMITPKLAVYGEFGGQVRLGGYGFNNLDITAGLRYTF